MRPASAPKSELFRLLRAPALIAWAVFIVAQPFYVLPTGLPQPGDLLLLPLTPIVLHGWDRRLSPAALSTLKALLWFTLWVAIVDYAWAALTGNWSLGGRDGIVLFPLYYLFNAIVVVLALVMHRRFGDLFLRVTIYTLGFVLAMLVVASVVMPSSSLRGSLFFANPNQLGYHALLTGCIVTVSQRRLALSSLNVGVTLAACAYLALLSASRSSVAGVAILVLMVVFTNLRVIVLASLAAIVVLQMGGPIARGIDASEQRVLNQQMPHLSFFEQRGYDRLVNNKQYLLLGAGEGANSRFKETTAIGAAEIHSSVATLLFCYGVVGTLLFGVFAWRMLRGAGLRASLMLVPPLLYTFAHQGMRFTMLWILVAVFIAIKRPPRPVHRAMQLTAP